MRTNYWSSGKFAKWLRSRFGLTNPTALTSDGWREWKKASQLAAPFIHWFTEVALNKIQNFICWPKDKLWDLRCALNSRFCDQYHTLQTRLNPWQYHEVDTRILHGLFETLVDFIEIEKAWMHVCWGQDENRKKFDYSWWEMNGWLNWIGTEKRHPEAGLAHLEWEMNLVLDDDWYGQNEVLIEEAKAKGEYGTLTNQAKSAKEQFELYNWWKNIRPNRPDPWEASGYNAYFARREKEGDDFFSFLGNTKEDRDENTRCWELCDKLEKAYENEDEEMLIRLIKLRKALWT